MFLTASSNRDEWYHESPFTYQWHAPREGVSNEESERRNLRMPSGNEQFAVVTRHNGGNHVRVQCEDGENRMGRIPGRMKYRTWINEGDTVLVEPWDFQDEKANIEWRYSGQDADQLREEGHID